MTDLDLSSIHNPKMMGRPTYWVLDEKRVPRPAKDVIEMAEFKNDFEKSCRVGKTFVSRYIEVSTVFLGIDHSWGRGGEPLLFETMIFGGALSEYQRRVSSWAAAEREHALACRRARLAMWLGWIPWFRFSYIESRWG